MSQPMLTTPRPTIELKWKFSKKDGHFKKAKWRTVAQESSQRAEG